jgi:hypothetical protein
MSTRRLPSSKRKTTRVKSEQLESFAHTLQLHRFAGVALGGGKTDRTGVAILEYYPQHRRVFLRKLDEKIKAEETISADQKLVELLSQDEVDLSSVGFDAPLQLPKCLRCHLRCPGYEKCDEPEILWMWKVHAERSKHKRPNKIFTPYTERCSEMHIANHLEEPFHPAHALGSNKAPLTARALFLKQRLTVPTFEVYPELTLWRLGRALRISKSHLRFYKHSFEGDESRLIFLKALVDHEIAFLYQQDIRTMVENWNAFEAFLCALTGFLRFRGQVEKKPKDFPRDEAWIEFPKETIEWFEA